MVLWWPGGGLRSPPWPVAGFPSATYTAQHSAAGVQTSPSGLAAGFPSATCTAQHSVAHSTSMRQSRPPTRDEGGGSSGHSLVQLQFIVRGWVITTAGCMLNNSEVNQLLTLHHAMATALG